jgi:hypothetical protein
MGSYRKNPKKYQVANKGKREENRRRVRAYLATHPCIDCGISDIRLLEFDHQRDKKAAITVMVNKPCSWGTIAKEIEKCLVRCANCHRIKTCEEQGWYRSVAEVEKADQLII